MIPGKRALVVDDSRSARVVLRGCWSATGSWSIRPIRPRLRSTTSRKSAPDVIFMDHLMPGMDGLQAVREIKAQSRPRRDPDHDVHVPGGRDLQQPGARLGRRRRAAEVDPAHRCHQGAVPAAAPAGPARRRAFRARAGRRAAAGRGCGPGSHRGHAAGRGAAEGSESRTPPLLRLDTRCLDPSHRRRTAPERPRRHRRGGAAATCPRARGRWPWVVATAASLAALGLVGLLYWQARVTAEQAERAFQAVTASNETLAKAIEKWRITGDAASDSAGQAGFRPLVLAVPFGEQALNPTRLESVRALVAQLERAAINGVVRIESFNGSFCLASAGEDGYTLAPPTSPASQCDQVGNPFDDSTCPASRQPIAFAQPRVVRAPAHGRRHRARAHQPGRATGSPWRIPRSSRRPPGNGTPRPSRTTGSRSASSSDELVSTAGMARQPAPAIDPAEPSDPPPLRRAARTGADPREQADSCSIAATA